MRIAVHRHPAVARFFGGPANSTMTNTTSSAVPPIVSMKPTEILGTCMVITLVVHMLMAGSHQKLMQENFPDASLDGRKLVESSLSEFSTRRSTSRGGTIRSTTVHDSSSPQLVWLMSFPNSGTSFTSRLVRDVSQTASASNYGDETSKGLQGIQEAVFADQPQGPFWIKHDDATEQMRHPSKYILTKTHCGMRCTLCPPEKYAETTYSFRRRCLTTKWMTEQQPRPPPNDDNDDGQPHPQQQPQQQPLERTFASYPSDRIAKAVHLIRNPFDNVVSRFHLEQSIPDRTAGKFDASRTGFREYCASVEQRYAASEKKVAFLDDDILELLQTVPCHDDFLRYIEWHNLAFATSADLGLDTYVLQFEWFATRYRETVGELLEFLELEKRGELTPFNSSSGSYDYFTDDERVAVREAFRIMASRRTWSHVAHYFRSSTEEVVETV